MNYFNGKRAAIELSMTTIIVVVLSLTLLIMGFVFVRSIMCGAIGVTDDIGAKVDKEVERLFATSGGELNCIGADEVVPMTPGLNTIHCVIQSSQGGTYRIEVESIESLSGIPVTVDLESWIVRPGDVYEVSPGDETRYKPIRINIPENAPEGTFTVKLDATKNGDESVTGAKELDFRITRTGVIRNVMC